MSPETKQCQNCSNDFVIETEDFEFYKKIDVPAPTFCPSCRLQRRLAWMISIRLWKRKCNMCEKDMVSMYHPDLPHNVVCPKCWWSDNWDSTDFARDYDFNRPFFEQWKELLQEVPLLGLSIDTESQKYSPFTNHCGHAKNCYMIFYADNNEDSLYGYYLAENKQVMDCGITAMSEKCFDVMHGYQNAKVIGSDHTRYSIDSAFLRYCDSCTNCFGSANLRNKSYVFFNEQLTKEEYKQKMSEIDLGSYKTYQEIKNKVRKHWKQYPPRSTWDDFSQDYTGNYVFQSKNCKECYQVFGAQDSKHLMLIKNQPVKDSYDYIDWGGNVQFAYECATVGVECAHVKFLQESGHNVRDVEYSKLHTSSSDCFGCVSVRGHKHCILNKQYTAEDYQSMLIKIKEHMKEMPYTSTTGHSYSYGEFFPMEFSPNAYNDMFAQLFFPKTENEAIVAGLGWNKDTKSAHQPTLHATDLLDHIKDVEDSILNEVIECDTCSKGYRVVQQELSFLREMNLPLPRTCPFCRVENQIITWSKNINMQDRDCSKCGTTFKTKFMAEEQPQVWCKKCYLQEVV